MPKHTATIKGSGTVGEIVEKRLELPGVSIESACPNCGKRVKHSFNGFHYLSFPVINKPFEYKFYHDCNDDHQEEWSVTVILKVTFELVNE